MKGKSITLTLIGLMFMLFIAGGCSPTEQISEAIKSPQPETKIQPTKESLLPTEVQKTPTATPKPSATELILTGKQGFVQETISGVFLFEVENPNDGYAIESSKYQITIYDENGTVLKTDSGYITLVLPMEKMFVAVDFYLEEGQNADRIDVQLDSGQPEELNLTEPPFSVDTIEFLPDDYFPRITGVVNNKLSRNISDLRVTAVAFDEEGTVIGGGYTYLNFLAPNGKSAVDINVEVDQTPASVEIYATLSGLSIFTEEGSSEGGLVLVDYGFTQDGTSAGVAFILQNTNMNSAIDASQYRVEAFDETGKVLDTDEGYINLVYPGETQAGFSDLFLPDGTKVAKVEVQISQGDPTSSTFTQNPLSAGQISYLPGDYFDYTTATISNSASQTIEDIKVVAVGFDDANKVIGGGFTFLDFVPAGGTTGVKISFDSDQTPAKLEIYQSMTSLSSISVTDTESTVEMVDFGYGISRNSIGVGFLVKSNETNSVIESTRYNVTAYDAEGYVLDEDSGYINVIFPEQIIAGTSELTIPSGKTLDYVDVQILSGRSEPVPAGGYPFSVENVTYFAGGYSPKATGIVKSTLTKDVDMIKLIAIAFDANDKIIGSGFTFVDFIPANGQSAVEVNMTVAGTPTRVELYPSFSSLSDISD